MRNLFPLIFLATICKVAYADFSEYLPTAKIKSEHVSAINLGAGMTRKLVHLNGEWANPYGIAYAKLGAFSNGDHEVGAQVGFRYPVALNGKDVNGFYLGAFAGHLRSVTVNRSDELQLGGGVDLSYVLLNKDRISTVSVAIAAGEELKAGDRKVYETKPEIQFAYTLSMGF